MYVGRTSADLPPADAQPPRALRVGLPSWVWRSPAHPTVDAIRRAPTLQGMGGSLPRLWCRRRVRSGWPRRHESQADLDLHLSALPRWVGRVARCARAGHARLGGHWCRPCPAGQTINPDQTPLVTLTYPRCRRCVPSASRATFEPSRPAASD